MEASRAKTSSGALEVTVAFLIKTRDFTHEHLRHGREDAPIAMLIGISEIRPGESAAKTKMKLEALARGQAGDDISQALAIGQLSKAEC